MASGASNEYLYGSLADCLTGLLLSAEDSDIAMIDGAYKVLTSNDENVLECTWQDLCSAVNYCLLTVHRADLSGDQFLGTNQNMTLFTQADRPLFILG